MDAVKYLNKMEVLIFNGKELENIYKWWNFQLAMFGYRRITPFGLSQAFLVEDASVVLVQSCLFKI